MSTWHCAQAHEVAADHISETRDVNWLCLYETYPKFHIPNLYHIGSTKTYEELDYCFTYRTEQAGEIFLLHLYISNHREGPFRVVVSVGDEINSGNVTNTAIITTIPKEFMFKGIPKLSHNYIHTYSFSDLDIEYLKKKYLYIAVSFPCDNNCIDSHHDIINIKLKHDYTTLLFQPIGSDLVLEAADGTMKFQVHKHIMIANSEVLKKKLMSMELRNENDCFESAKGNYFQFTSRYNCYKLGYKHHYFKVGDRSNKINFIGMGVPRYRYRVNYKLGENRDYYKFEDINFEVLRCMVEFLYMGLVIDTDNVNFVEVLKCANKYELHTFSEFFQHILSDKLNLINAVEILVVAHDCEADFLKRCALKFIATNRKLLKSSTFKEINNIELLTDLCKFLLL